MKRTRLAPAARKEDILAVALPLAERVGYRVVTREQVATEAGVSGPVLSYHFGSMDAFRAELMAYAVTKENLAVIAQGLSCGDPTAQKAPEALRRRALGSLLG